MDTLLLLLICNIRVLNFFKKIHNLSAWKKNKPRHDLLHDAARNLYEIIKWKLSLPRTTLGQTCSKKRRRCSNIDEKAVKRDYV